MKLSFPATMLIGMVLMMTTWSIINIKGEKEFICNTTLPGLLSCKAAATRPPPPPPAPTANCCKVLSWANLSCLCTYKNSSVLAVIGIDPQLAVNLPGKCNIPHPTC
ncbi:putative lipid-transfer protein DIR1 [Impatiens glandulifera]|uniref:putative lipid-transfer protein DIR1 n=1 Tax=Impatiens glandulifera TaxID=253017 RepID=UPI001FB13D51|nr:putative lipid-transfer protein DIR1 [Impatiens glandulifera]